MGARVQMFTENNIQTNAWLELMLGLRAGRGGGHILKNVWAFNYSYILVSPIIMNMMIHEATTLSPTDA